jgi:hypothetical protein
MDDMDGITVHGNIAFMTFIRVGKAILFLKKGIGVVEIAFWRYNKGGGCVF